jgi:hypothetical protein
VWSSCSNSLTACASASSVMFSASTRVHGSLPSHQDSDPSWRFTLLDAGQKYTDSSRLEKVSAPQRLLQQVDIHTCENRGSSWLLMSLSFPTSRLDRQHGYVLTIISISVVCAATRRGTGVRELPFGDYWCCVSPARIPA